MPTPAFFLPSDVSEPFHPAFLTSAFLKARVKYSGLIKGHSRGICGKEAQNSPSPASPSSEIFESLPPHAAKGFGAIKFHFTWARIWSKFALANASAVRTPPAPGTSTEKAQHQDQPGPTSHFPFLHQLPQKSIPTTYTPNS